MATISGSIKGARCISATDAHTGYGAREVWLLSVSAAAYTGSADTFALATVGALIGSTFAKDGKTRTLRWGVPAHAGYDTANQAVYAGGASVAALTISSDDLTGNLVIAAGTEITATTAAAGIGIMVGVDIS